MVTSGRNSYCIIGLILRIQMPARLNIGCEMHLVGFFRDLFAVEVPAYRTLRI